MESFRFQHPDYYVGIGCPCCIGMKDFKWMRDNSGQPVWNLTYNNIFVNANYQPFLLEILPILMEKNSILIGPEEAESKVGTFGEFGFPVSQNAWVFAEDYIHTLERLITQRSEPSVFLFSAGPLSEVLIHRAMLISTMHTYIDIGSTLDPIIFGKPTRGYHSGSGTAHKICHWG